MTRPTRIGAAVAVVGILATSAAFVVARNDVDRLSQRNTDRAASAALLKVQSLTASVDQVLSTANGVVAATNLDANRFTEVLGPDVDASPTLGGLALVVDGPTGPQVRSRVGQVDLLTGHEQAVQVAGSSARLVTWRAGPDGTTLGFASRVARNAGSVFLQVLLPREQAPGSRFAIARESRGGDTVVLGTVGTTRGLTRWDTPVSIGGTELALFVTPGRAPTGFLGVALPTVILLLGAVITAIATGLAVALARRSAAVATLGDENRALDDALARARKGEARLRASEDRFRTILRNTPDAIAIVDPERGSCELLNRRTLAGHSREELRQPDGLARIVAPEARGDAQRYWEALAQLEPEKVAETALRIADASGQTRHLRFRFSSLPRPKGPPVLLGMVSDITDATEQREREEELQQALHRSQRLDAVGQLASGVAHDFNNLLMVILGFAELLKSEDLTPHGREHRAEIERAANRGSALVRKLLAFGRRDAPQLKPIDLSRLVSTLAPMLERALGESVQLQVVAPPVPCTVVADPVQVEQVILNLAVNARDAMPGGGVLYVAVEGPGTTTADAAEHVVLTVTDTGSGIPPEVRDTIFDPFVTTKEAGKGTGLGLATVASIVDGLGGSISVISSPGRGTTFEIAIPYVAGEPATEDAGADKPPVDGRGRRILLVDDEAPLRSALAKVLEAHAFEVKAVASASDALRELDAGAVDIVVSDVVMPTMSGVQLAAHVRADLPDLPIVLMSGYSDELAGVGRDAPLTRLLRKPFTHQELLTAVDALLTDESLDSVV
jgi:two-component system, cell cycle sensor histidine kinase and response regulator CckA